MSSSNQVMQVQESSREAERKRKFSNMEICDASVVETRRPVGECATVKEVWEKLQTTFEDSGLTRKVSLLRTLVIIQLQKCRDVEEYVNIITTTAHKLNGVGFKVSDEWVGTLLLAGLPENKVEGCTVLSLTEQPNTSEQNEKKTVPTQSKTYWAFLSLMGTNGGNWYVDSCASNHISAVDEGLRNERKCSVAKVTMANKQGMSARSTGDMSLEVPTSNGIQEITTCNVLHVPESSVNLLSHDVARRWNIQARHRSGQGLLCGRATNGRTLRQETCHLHYLGVSKLSNDTATGIKLSNIEEKPCIPCIKGKIAKKSFPKEGKRAKEILEVIHSDLCGPMESASIGGARYFITLIDDFSRKVFIYFLTEKGQARDVIVNFRMFVEKQTTKEIKSIRIDNGDLRLAELAGKLQKKQRRGPALWLLQAYCNHNASCAVEDSAMYSASVVDNATVRCFLLCQDIGPPWKRKMLPVIECLLSASFT
ncbi:uncharacterized protein LOC124422138 [Vespa crabro]|uniref:uncharacterized protein LOC124422138 n=1 Tax=Vespa crabro TaxID=7445 RepID=UPI001F00D357|nr:uncharacterized protein LOC124422138 [Vespa crabro]